MRAAIAAAIILAAWIYAADLLLGGKAKQQVAQVIR